MNQLSAIVVVSFTFGSNANGFMVLVIASSELKLRRPNARSFRCRPAGPSLPRKGGGSEMVARMADRRCEGDGGMMTNPQENLLYPN